MKKVVGYVRVSTDAQVREGISLEAQKDKIKAWAEIQDQDRICIEEDAGISGKLIKNREGLKCAIEIACNETASGSLLPFKALQKYKRRISACREAG